MDDALRSTLLGIADRMGDARDPWWIIASAAAALHGARVSVADVDLLVSRRDGAALLAGLGLTGSAEPSDRFRSDPFARWSALPLPVDIMADFQVLDGTVWRRVQPLTRVAVPIEGAILPVPALAELIEQCLLFGRRKDIARAAILQRLRHEADMRPRTT